MADRFVYTTPEDPRARPLVEDLIREYDNRYGTFFDPGGAAVELSRYPASDFAPPNGNFLLVLRGSATIAGGAFKRFDERTAEVKRMWTRSDLRRQGLASYVLAELERQAARQGYERFYLTTGFRQPEAERLYLSDGYTPLYDVQADRETLRQLAFEKALLPPAVTSASEAGPGRTRRLAGARAS